jgi:hypothetical protein
MTNPSSSRFKIVLTLAASCEPPFDIELPVSRQCAGPEKLRRLM